MRALKVTALCLLALGAALAVLAGFSRLPSLEGRTVSTAISDTGTTPLGQAIAPHVAAHPGESGLYSLIDAREAFAARIFLANAAQSTLDVQYYIWRDDMSGTMLFEALHAAADRGVRVRLLLDDNNTSGLDTILAALDSHANIEVRLFNPFVLRKPRALGYLTDFLRLNRRMHNKSFTADNQATIIGGRNVGDEYFGATDDVLFADLDVLAIGPVVNEVSRDFDRYWASESSYPVSLLVPHAERTRLAELAAAAASARQGPAAAAYLRAIRDTALIGKLAEDDLELDWAATRMVSDDPAKGLGRAAHEDLLPQRLKEILGEPASELQLVSPYFVPAAAGEEWFAAIARRGVSVRVLTNSFEATDVALVHAGYAKRREELLESGIALYEMKLRTPAQALRDRGLSGSSGSSLHAKTFAVDGARMFVGSFNFDPRSADLNTEMGFVIESPVMARRMTAALDDSLAEVAYEVRLSETGQVLWIERGAGEVIQRDSEPGMSAWQRIAVSALSMLPIEWLL